MIISRTPFRISLFGGGTDYPAWYREHGGAVLGFAINKYCYISMRLLPPFFAHKHRLVYSRVELVNALAEIQHPAVRAVLQSHEVPCGLEIHHDGDLPARAGLGSSSAFTVGLLHALHALRGQMVTSGWLATEAIRIEQGVIGENVGSQDQVWAAHGGINRIDFHRDDTYELSPLIMKPERKERLIASCMLVFTGLSRLASNIAADKIANFQKRTGHLHKIRAMVDEALAILTSATRSIDEIGLLLHEGWRLKRELADSVSTPLIDEIYEAARSAGALGGKVLGAGGGGFMLLFVPPERQERVAERLKNYICLGVNIDTSGSKIVVYEPDGLGN